MDYKIGRYPFTDTAHFVPNNRNHKMKFIKLSDVVKVTSLSKSTIYRLIAENDFPRQVPLGGKSVAWVESEVEEWMKEKTHHR